MSTPGRFHQVLQIDSRQRTSGTPQQFEITFADALRIPQGSQTFMVCTVWSADTTDMTDDPRTQSLMLLIPELCTSTDTFSTLNGGVQVPACAFISNVDNALNVATSNGSAAFPVRLESGKYLRRLTCIVVGGDLQPVTSGLGEWQALFSIVVMVPESRDPVPDGYLTARKGTHRTVNSSGLDGQSSLAQHMQARRRQAS